MPLLKYRKLSGEIMEQVNKFGVFKGEPKAAAKKAYYGIIKSLLLEKKDPTNISFELKEITRGKPKKIYKWIGKCNKTPILKIKKIDKKDGSVKEVKTKDYNMQIEPNNNNNILINEEREEIIEL